MWEKIKALGKGAKVVGKVQEAHKEFKEAKAHGEVSMVKELGVGVVAPGAAWLMFRGTLTGVVAAVLAGLVQVADPFLASDLSAIFTPEVIDGASVALVGLGFLWTVLDLVRSFARTGLFPGH
jgi:hypothetical protein